MNHDPLCEKGWGYPDFIVSRGIKRKDCWMCDLLRQAEQRGHDEAMDMDPVRRRDAYLHGERDMLAKCIAAVEFLHDHNPDQASAFWYAINELRALSASADNDWNIYERRQEKP